MARTTRTPADLARRVAARTGSRPPEDRETPGGFSRETYRLPREEARETARAWFRRYPKAAYMTRVESWRVTDDGLIEFTMRRLPTADGARDPVSRDLVPPDPLPRPRVLQTAS